MKVKDLLFLLSEMPADADVVASDLPNRKAKKSGLMEWLGDLLDE
jgi:hypothetical protein